MSGMCQTCLNGPATVPPIPPSRAPDTAASGVSLIDPDITETSKRLIRAHAYRLVAGRRDALRTLTDTERRAELLTLAEHVADREPHADALATAALPYLTSVPNPAAHFEALVEAVLVRGRFTSDPDEWLARHDLPLGTVVYETHDEKTQTDVDQALDVLCGGAS